MAYIRAIGFDVPMVFPLSNSGSAIVTENVLNLNFGFALLSMHIVEEVISQSGAIEKTIYQVSLLNDGGVYWNLNPGRYRCFGLNPVEMVATTELFNPNSGTSSVQLRTVKIESLENVVELLSDSSDEDSSVKDTLLHGNDPPRSTPQIVNFFG